MFFFKTVCKPKYSKKQTFKGKYKSLRNINIYYLVLTYFYII